MSAPTTIARPEIAERLGISLTTLVNIIRYTDAEVPEPLGYEGRHLAYDRAIMLAWIATKPLENIKWQYRPKKVSVVEQTADFNRAFITGKIGVSSAQRNRVQLKKVVAKHMMGTSMRVEVNGCDDYTCSRSSMARLV